MKYDITFHPKWWHKNAGIFFTQDFFDDPDTRIAADVKMRKTLYEKFGKYGLGEENPKPRPLLGTDLLAAGYLHSQLMGCEIIYQKDNSPQVVPQNLTIDDVDELPIPDLDQNEIWSVTQKQIDELLRRFGRVETYVNLMGIQNVAMDVMGQELFFAYYEEEEKVHELLNKVTQLSIDIGKRFKALSGDISGGVTSIVRKIDPETYLTSNCSVEMVSQDIYQEFLLPYDRALQEAFGEFSIHHCGKMMEKWVEAYAKLGPMKFAEVGAFSDIAFVREVLPDTHLNARYSPVRLSTASEQEIFEEVEQLVKEGSNRCGMVSVSCVGIGDDVTDEKIEWFLQACISNLINQLD